MSGAFSKPLEGFGGPANPLGMSYNSIDSHGLNAGLGTSGQPSFPSKINTGPAQAARMANSTRFSPADWSASNIDHYNGADASRNNSERVRNEAVRLMREREDKTVTTQRDADRRIGERLGDETYWRGEIQSELEANLNFTHQLEDTRKKMEKALAETEGPLRVNSENVHFREGRKEIDLVGDQVEHSLMREIDNIKSWQQQLARWLEGVNHQLGVNRQARHQLEGDLANKDHGINIDHRVHQLQNNSRDINLHGGIEKVDNNISIPETWADYSHRNIQASQAARSATARMISEVDNLITQAANEMWSHWNNTNMSFQQRITESNDAHNKLQSHLSKTMQEIYDQEKHIEALKKALRDKGPPLKVAQTRLEARAHRPDVELCRDPPHLRLVEEVGQLQESIDLLNRKLSEADSAHQDLLRNKARLEHDIKIKSNSLFIDREKCLSMRKSFPVVSLATKL
jgi:tektin-3